MTKKYCILLLILHYCNVPHYSTVLAADININTKFNTNDSKAVNIEQW